MKARLISAALALCLALAPVFAWAVPPAIGPVTAVQSGIWTVRQRGPGTPTVTSVSVAANTSTQLIGANATRRALSIIPKNNQTCYADASGGTASAASTWIPGGWNWEENSPPPATAVTVLCTTDATIAVTETN